jgi:hypothetical protein
MLVLFNGLSHFGKKLVTELNEFDPDNKYVFLDTYTSLKAKLLFILLLPFSKLVVSFNGVSERSGSMDWVLRFNKKLLMQWQGTDVQLALQRAQDGVIYNRYITHANHTTDFLFLKKELDTIINYVTLLPYKHYSKDAVELINYKQLSVLSYVAKNREDFYGMHLIQQLAIKYPSIFFYIVGTDNEQFITSENLKLLGWVDQVKLSNLMKENPIFLRLTKHDGNAVTVHEALLHGQEVIWSYPNELVYQATNLEELFMQFEVVLEKISNRGMKSNVYNSNFIYSNYKREVILGNYVAFLNSIVFSK